MNARVPGQVGARVVRRLRNAGCANRAASIDAKARAGYSPLVIAVVEEAEALHADVRRAIAVMGPTDEAAFDDLARRIAVFQARHVPGYARLLAARGLDVQRAPIASLPAVPTDAFRVSRVATHPPSLDVATFRTSGTTGSLAGRGAHALRTLDTYRAASLAWAKNTLFAPFFAGTESGMNIHSALTQPAINTATATVIAISPSPAELPDSSLARMMGWFVDELGGAGSGSAFVPADDLARAVAVLDAASRGSRPVVVLATAFAWVHLLDRLGKTILPLPRTSRAMQTGGFKGRSREISKEDLRVGIARALGLSERDVIGEYGMTELTSQLYATPERRGDETPWIYRAPPWVRVRACDPSTLATLPQGRRGIARIEDLANVESAWAIQTADEVVVHEDGGVELFGRLPGETPRGCSLAIEELLEQAQERAS